MKLLVVAFSVLLTQLAWAQDAGETKFHYYNYNDSFHYLVHKNSICIKPCEWTGISQGEVYGFIIYNIYYVNMLLLII